MKIKTPQEFISFSDGVCGLYATEKNQLADKKFDLYYTDKVIGVKRYYTAKSATVEINKLIQVPKQNTITATDNITIGNERFKIEQIQHLQDTNPPSTILTLRKIGVIV